MCTPKQSWCPYSSVEALTKDNPTKDHPYITILLPTPTQRLKVEGQLDRTGRAQRVRVEGELVTCGRAGRAQRLRVEG